MDQLIQINIKKYFLTQMCIRETDYLRVTEVFILRMPVKVTLVDKVQEISQQLLLHLSGMDIKIIANFGSSDF